SALQINYLLINFVYFTFIQITDCNIYNYSIINYNQNRAYQFLLFLLIKQNLESNNFLQNQSFNFLIKEEFKLLILSKLKLKNKLLSKYDYEIKKAQRKMIYKSTNLIKYISLIIKNIVNTFSKQIKKTQNCKCVNSSYIILFLMNLNKRKLLYLNFYQFFFFNKLNIATSKYQITNNGKSNQY
ncbi:hypothetical protein IMG5_004480, partial [Ichthyophthirius multifiliis]